MVPWAPGQVITGSSVYTPRGMDLRSGQIEVGGFDERSALTATAIRRRITFTARAALPPRDKEWLAEARRAAEWTDSAGEAYSVAPVAPHWSLSIL